MAKAVISTKRLAISKANTQVVIVVGVAAFLSVFSLVAAHAVFGQNQYQSRVITAKQKAHAQLLANIKSVDQLQSSYASFYNSPTNVIGGSSTGTGQNDGTNPKIILDALPDKYDFPALASSIENILTSAGLNIDGISGTDDQVAQQSNTTSTNPTAVPIPFSFSISKANYASVESLITELQNSIRPISVDTLTISGGANDMTLNVTAHTYYQPGKSLNITTEVIK